MFVTPTADARHQLREDLPEYISYVHLFMTSYNTTNGMAATGAAEFMQNIFVCVCQIKGASQ